MITDECLNYLCMNASTIMTLQITKTIVGTLFAFTIVAMGYNFLKNPEK